MFKRWNFCSCEDFFQTVYYGFPELIQRVPPSQLKTSNLGHLDRIFIHFNKANLSLNVKIYSGHFFPLVSLCLDIITIYVVHRSF